MQEAPSDEPSNEPSTLSSNSQDAAGSTQVKRDDQFYFHLVTFQVEDRLFRVLRDRFVAESEVFADMFKLPVPQGAVADGESDAQPIHLEGISKDAFRILLSLMYNRKSPTTIEGWVSLLETSQRWDMTGIQEHAVSGLSELITHPAERVEYARRFGIDEWLLPAYTALIVRKRALTMDDVKFLGIEDALKIASLRERTGVKYTTLRIEPRNALSFAQVSPEWMELAQATLIDVEVTPSKKA
ncbi:hypothetical protein HGRIS_001948 [Hohenbuehelia grisea]|uniref:BTB domain-containing protein n=1 Tax=Hohenbuehelia grisea TaxID=104357 RepID=A0ABR3JJL7_9AGAR